MALSNEEILSWFCATNPIPSVPEAVDVSLPAPGHGMRKAELAATERERARLGDAPGERHVRRRGRGRGRGWRGEEEDPGPPGLIDEPEDDFKLENYFTTVDPYAGFETGGVDVVEAATDIYSLYDFDTNKTPPNLPIAQYREEVVRTIEANQVTIIQGSTGSGKSTQVPQYILDHYAAEGNHCNIICTQPRRIAATSLAKFVAESRGWNLGSLVGYQIGLDRMASEDTRLTFVTTEILLRRLISVRNMNMYTHVVIDEVHERDLDVDFLMLIVRLLSRTNSKHVKIILMSATLESDMFAQYFSVRVGHNRMEPAPILSVEGRCHPVIEFYLDDLRNLGQCEAMSRENPRVTDDVMEMTCQLLRLFDQLEADKSEGSAREETFRGTVLVFLPGMPEINEMTTKLTNTCSALQLEITPLHSSISIMDQRKVFMLPKIGERKVILATNIAESSITVPSIKYVIDFCLVKQLTRDLSTDLTCLRLTWASKASLTQRQGRAGRVAQGRCYRLITREFYRQHIPEYSIPEMQRCPLENVVLYAKMLGIAEPRVILAKALQSPDLDDIEQTILNLKEVGALTVTMDDKVNPYDGNLTFLGRVLAELPLEIHLGKLLVLGHAFGCLEECLVIAAALSTKSFFVNTFRAEMKGYKSKMSWDGHSHSDCLAILNAYREWYCRKEMRKFRSDRTEESWCRDNLIDKKTINIVSELVRDLTQRLSRFNIEPMKQLVSRMNETHYDTLILKLVLCGAFYPNYFRWGLADEELNQKEISGHDPTTTVMVGGLPPAAHNYAVHVAGLFHECRRGKALHFEGQKVFVEFERQRPSRTMQSGNVSQVLEEVYLALKLRQLRKRLELYVSKRDIERRISQPYMDPIGGLVRLELGEAKEEEVFASGSLPAFDLPKFGSLPVRVTEVIDPHHFWVQLSDSQSKKQLENIMDSIATDPLVPLKVQPSCLRGSYCLALYLGDYKYYRAKIENVIVEENRAQVLFIDYGNVEWVLLDSLCKMTIRCWLFPPQAFECSLTGVRPSYKCSPDGEWTAPAILQFTELVMNDRDLLAEVYSVVENVVRLELFDKDGHDLLINKVLVCSGFAERCDESYQSKLAHMEGTSLKSRKEKEVAMEGKRFQKRECEEDERRKKAVVADHSVTAITVPWPRHPIPQKDTRGQKFVLKGPNNPYEVSFYSMTAVGSTRPTRIERNSVNSVVVDNEAQDKHERLMVAAHMSMSASGSAVMARDCTLLPNIHGLAHLVCLLFAPTIEMRADELKRQYVGALCGLGADPKTGESLLKEREITIVFDTLITQKDLHDINSIRQTVNVALSSDNASAQWGVKAVLKFQANARELIKRLILLEPRKSVTPYQSMLQGWNRISPADLLQRLDEDPSLPPPIYSMHSAIDISGVRIDQQRSARVLVLREEVKELHRIAASRSEQSETLRCGLCNEVCGCAEELHRHLVTKGHRLRERKLFRDDPDLDSPAVSTEKPFL